MVKFLLTEELRGLIDSSGLDESDKHSLLSRDYILHQDLISFYQSFQVTQTFIELTSKTKLYVPNKSKPRTSEKTDGFIKNMERLRLKQREEEYQRLVRPKNDFGTMYEQVDDCSPLQMQKELKSQVTTIFNIMISVGSVVYAIWYWTETSWRLSNGLRVLMCLFFGIVVLIAEITVYSGYLRRIEEARVKERKKKEVKKVVKTYKFAKLD